MSDFNDYGLTVEELSEGLKVFGEVFRSEEFQRASTIQLLMYGSAEDILRELAYRHPENKEYQERLDNYNKPISKIKRFLKSVFSEQS